MSEFAATYSSFSNSLFFVHFHFPFSLLILQRTLSSTLLVCTEHSIFSFLLLLFCSSTVTISQNYFTHKNINKKKLNKRIGTETIMSLEMFFFSFLIFGSRFPRVVVERKKLKRNIQETLHAVTNFAYHVSL